MIYNENCLETMSKFLSDSIDLILTSPPYDNLRSYGGYSFDFEPIASEIYRVTKPGGILVWIVGDATINGSETGTSFRQALFFKSLGFNLHDTMIYEKTPSYPAGYRSNRYSQSFEYMFVFSKGKPKSVNLIKDRQNRWAGSQSFGTQSERLNNGNLKKRKIIQVQELGMRYNIWNYATGKRFTTKDDFLFKHPAMFPEKLAEDHILSWSNPGDLVYDPFAGSGTTLKMAIVNERKCIGSEINAEYCELIKRRLGIFISK